MDPIFVARKNSAARLAAIFLLGLVSIPFLPQQMNAQSRSLSTGIEGVVSIGPIHGGPSRVGVADSAPLPNATFEIANEAGPVALFTTDASRHFRISLPPGRYSIKAKEPKARLPRCGPLEVEVNTEGFKKVEWQCDSGMR